MDVSMIFKIVGVAMILVIIDKVLDMCNKSEVKTFTNLVGIIIILTMVLGMVSNLFGTVKTMFQI